MCFSLKTLFVSLIFWMDVWSLNLDSSTQFIEPGVSKYLVVNCSSSKGSDPTIDELTSLTISRAVKNKKNKYETLGSINSKTGQPIINPDNAVGLGVMDNKGDSYISLQWSYPMDDLAGEYRCQAKGMDKAGKPATATEKKIKVTSASLSLRTLGDGMRRLLISMDKIESRIEASKHWFFKISDVYKGRRYYLSQQDPIARSEQNMATCAFYGGYLAEIDDWEEMNFTRSFIKQFTGFKLVLIGGTDEAKEEVWRYRVSNKLVPEYLVRSRKLGPIYNCLTLFDDVDWFAVDVNCYWTTPQYPARFLCEIPE